MLTGRDPVKLRSVGALIGAAVLTFGLVSNALAAPAYAISITKTADPTTCSSTSCLVTYTIVVTNTTVSNGGGAFEAVIVSDPNCDAGTLAFASSSDGSDPASNNDNKLAEGASWTYTCTRDLTGAAAGTYDNTATVKACHDSSVDVCNNPDHHADATGSASATVTVVAASEAPSASPSASPAAAASPSTPTTSTTSSSADSSLPWLATIIALVSVIGLALAPRPRRKRQ